MQEERVVAGDVAARRARRRAGRAHAPASGGSAPPRGSTTPSTSSCCFTISGYAPPITSTVASTSAGVTSLLGAEQERVPHRAPDDAPQHVAALLVGRHHAVGDEEGHRAAVLGEDPQRDVARRPREGAVLDAGDRLGRRDQRAEHVDVPHRRGVLEDGEVALEPGAGVDARRRQRHQLAVGLGVELHEHEVPDLDVAVLVLGRTGGRPVARARGPRRSPSSGRTGRCRPCARSCRHPGAGSARAGRPTTSRQICSASSSVVCTVTQRRSGSRPSTSV